MNKQKIKSSIQKIKIDKKRRKQILGILGILIVGLLVKELASVWPEAKLYVANADYTTLAVSTFMYMLGMFLNGVAWCVILRFLDKTILMSDCMNIHFTSAFARYIPGGIWGLVGKAVECRTRGVDKSVVYFSILIEYAYIVSTAASFILLLVPGSDINYIQVLCIGLVLIVVGLFVLSLAYKHPKVQEIWELFREMIQRMSVMQIVQVAIIYLVSWALIGGGFMLLGKAFFEMSSDESLKLVAFYPVSWVVGFLSPFPNGIGAREWCLNIFLGMSYATEITVLISCLSRVWATVGECISYAIFKVCYLIHKRR